MLEAKKCLPVVAVAASTALQNEMLLGVKTSVCCVRCGGRRLVSADLVWKASKSHARTHTPRTCVVLCYTPMLFSLSIINYVGNGSTKNTHIGRGCWKSKSKRNNKNEAAMLYITAQTLSLLTFWRKSDEIIVINVWVYNQVRRNKNQIKLNIFLSPSNSF